MTGGTIFFQSRCAEAASTTCSRPSSSLDSHALLRTLEGRAQLAIITLWLSVALAVADAYAHANRLKLVQDALDGLPEGTFIAIPAAELERADDYVTAALIGSTLALVVTAVAWLAWQHRVAVLLRARTRGWRGDPRTGVVVWLLPVVNLVAPLLVVVELVRAAGRRMHVALAAWWLAWLGAAVLAGVGTSNPDALADQRLPDGLAVAGDVLAVAAALIAIGIVRHVTVDVHVDPAGGDQAASA